MAGRCVGSYRKRIHEFAGIRLRPCRCEPLCIHGRCQAQRFDEETGVVSVGRLHVSVYAGSVVSRAGGVLQNEGSIVMGLGSALFEQVAFVDGHVTNANLSDYEIPSIADLPPITHDLLEKQGAEVHGLGETALPPVPAAIGNALASLGIHVRELPMSAEAVLQAVDARDAGRVDAPAEVPA